MEKDNAKITTRITTICIPTCNRPEQLRSILSSLIDHLEKYSRSPRILIVDDSEDTQSAGQSREIVGSYSVKYQGVLEFMDRNDRKTLATHVAKEKNIPEEVVNFALCGDKASSTTAGSSRNTFLLKTRGEKIFMIDDDVVYRFFSPLTEDAPFFTIENPNEYYFLKENEMPPAKDFKVVETDFISAHENMLGKKASEILGKNTPEYMVDLEIVDTFMGSYGDSPMTSHISLLLSPRVQEKLKNISLDEYRAMKETKRIIRTPLSQTVYQGIMCISMVMGIDNRNLVPPFLSVGRGQDFIFGVTRSKAFPLKLSGYIPLLIGHERPHKETRPLGYDGVREITKTSRIIASLIEEMEDVDIDPRENLHRIGAKFIDISSESADNFKMIMEAQCNKIIKTVVNRIDSLLENSYGMPDFWIDDMKSIKSSLDARNPENFMIDITKNQKETKAEDRMIILQKWMNLYGRLLQEWHKLL